MDSDSPLETDLCKIGQITATHHLCNSAEFDKKIGNILVSQLDVRDQQLLTIRTRDGDGIHTIDPINDDNLTICHHHKAQFLSRYTERQ